MGVGGGIQAGDGMSLGEYSTIAAAALVLVLVGYFAVKDSEQWDQFRQDHECKKVGEISGTTSTGYGITTSGQGGMVTTYTPGKTGWTCNDGVTYWR